jgi:hypothetical protein
MSLKEEFINQFVWNNKYVEDSYKNLIFEPLGEIILVSKAEKFLLLINEMLVKKFKEFCDKNNISTTEFKDQKFSQTVKKKEASWDKIAIGGIVTSLLVPHLAVITGAGLLTHFLDKKFILKQKLIDITIERSKYLMSSFLDFFDKHEATEKENFLKSKESAYIKNDSHYYEKNSLLEKLKKDFGFEGFHHYTDLSNIASIFKKRKLLSRDNQDNSIVIDSANSEIIQHTESRIKQYVRFFYKENTPTTYDNEGIKIGANYRAHMPIPVLLVFDEHIIYSNDVAFLSGGGGNKESVFTTSAYEAKKFDWSRIFSRGPIKEDEQLKKYIVNCRNAEFLLKKEISIDNLKKIVFRSPADYKMFNKTNDIIGICEIDYVQRKFHYKKENNFLYDFTYNFVGTNLSLDLTFFSENLNNYNIILRVITIEKIIIDLNINLPNYKSFDSFNLDLKVSGRYVKINLKSLTSDKIGSFQLFVNEFLSVKGAAQ